MSAGKALYLASTGGGNDRPALLRVLVGMGVAILASLLVVWLMPPVPDTSGNELLSLLPALAGIAGGLWGTLWLAPLLISETPSHCLVLEDSRLSLYEPGVQKATFSCKNKGLQIECRGSGNHAIAIRINGERRALSAHYVEIDRARFHALCQGSKGEKYRVPYVLMREHENSIQAVRIRPSGRYSCTEELLR